MLSASSEPVSQRVSRIPPARRERPDLILQGSDRLSSIERWNIRAIRRTLEPGPIDRAMRWCQRHIGAEWIHHSTKHLLNVHGLDRLPPLDPDRSYICASNHRSFFDLYVVTAYLVKRGLPHRLVFPVRSEFFYDHPLGFFVNGAMSFFAMYPPIFRDPARAVLNLSGLDEIASMLSRGGTFVGMHPEGTRGKGADPYTLLPAQPGLGRLIHRSNATVIPVFVNGLINDLPRQVTSNFARTGIPIHAVFGRPVDFTDLFERKGSPRVYRAVADRVRDVITELGQEERRARAQSMRSA